MIDVVDSRDVSINNFTISGGASGVVCLDRSLCRLNGNTIQGANFSGVGVFFSQTDVFGGLLQNNVTGLSVFNGSEAKAQGVTIQNNGTGIELRAHALLNTNSVVTANSGTGIFATHNSTLNCIGCQLMGNGDHGLILRRNSTARIYAGAAITGNTGGGVLLSEESSAALTALSQSIHSGLAEAYRALSAAEGGTPCRALGACCWRASGIVWRQKAPCGAGLRRWGSRVQPLKLPRGLGAAAQFHVRRRLMHLLELYRAYLSSL